jgi:selenocysteine lyase/cysteine desulfurase
VEGEHDPAGPERAMTDFRHEFPILETLTFLNHAAVAPIPRRGAEALRALAGEAETMGSAAWPRWAERLKRARREGARLLGLARENDLGFVHNTTHGLLCVANSLDWRPGDNIVTAAREFPANVQAWRQLRERGVALRPVAERPDFRFDAADFERAIDDRTRLVAVSMVQYATGYRMPVEALAEICQRRGIRLVLDAIQAIGALPTRVDALGCDAIVADGHKWMLGPEGIGLLWVRPEWCAAMNESMTGWVGRERPWDYDDAEQKLLPDARRFEEGSHNMAGAAALGESLALLNEVGIDAVTAAIGELTDRLIEGARRLGLTVVSPRGEGERSGIVALTAEGFDAAAVAAALEKESIIVAARRGWLRVSPHFYNTPAQIDRLLEALGPWAPRGRGR